MQLPITLMQPEKSENEPVYCICKTTDIKKFMIGCDHCNEWFHGECINVTQTDSERIKRFFCDPCLARDSSLAIEYKESKVHSHLKRRREGYEDGDPEGEQPNTIEEISTKRPKLELEDLKHRMAVQEKAGDPASTGCGKCIGCFRNQDCGKCDACKEKKKFGGPGTKEKCKLRHCVNPGRNFLPNPVLPSAIEPENNNKQGGVKLKHVQRNPKKTMPRATWNDRPHSEKHAAARRRTPTDHFNDEDSGDLVQCLGPKCVNAARPGSKYCSDACGLKLATLRLKTFMPEKVERFKANGGPAATKLDEARLVKVQKKQLDAKSRLEQVDQQENELNAHCERVCAISLQRSAAAESQSSQGLSDYETASDSEIGVPGGEASETDQHVFCVTCGHEVNVKAALRHMTKCFNKYEGLTSYGSATKTTSNPYNLFCHAYNRINATYCKRFRVICPEHAKDPKVDDSDMCGYPLGETPVKIVESVNNTNTSLPTIPSPASTKFCKISKKRCTRHYKWERIQRAMIDMERLSLLLKLEELCEEERDTKEAMANRCSVLGLLLHDTKDPNEDSQRVSVQA